MGVELCSLCLFVFEKSMLLTDLSTDVVCLCVSVCMLFCVMCLSLREQQHYVVIRALECSVCVCVCVCVRECVYGCVCWATMSGTTCSLSPGGCHSVTPELPPLSPSPSLLPVTRPSALLLHIHAYLTGECT